MLIKLLIDASQVADRHLSRGCVCVYQSAEWALVKGLLPLGLALGSPIFPSGCEGKLGVALESLQGLLVVLVRFGSRRFSGTL